ncbi:Vacuolar protein sorting-associated protein 18 like protein, partial [Gonapodya sp. JEL0774]
GDWDRVVAHLVSIKRWEEAVDSLATKVPLARARELWYKYAAELLVERPAETVAGWIRMGGGLNPKHLIPAMVRYEASRTAGGHEKPEQDQAVRYLRFAVDKMGNRDAAVHNYLVGLYVGKAGEVGEESSGLLEFLRGHPVPHYDLHYALRLCSQAGLVSSCVAICQSVGLWDEAVELALASGRVADAEGCADRARAGGGMPTTTGYSDLLDDDDEDTRELRRKLWLRIARHVVEEKKDIKSAIELIKKSSDLLKLADILPFFPDFVLIDDFKDEICA